MPPTVCRLGLFLLLVLAGMIGLGAACNGRRGKTTVAPQSIRPTTDTPTVRIYYLVDLDGYLEPCGCQSRPLGGIDRLARLMETERSRAPRSLFVAVGNLLYAEPQLDPRMVFQETSKAEAIVRILDRLQLLAFAPGPADFARGVDEWQRLITRGHATALVANTTSELLTTVCRRSVLREIDGIRVGIVGVADLQTDGTTESSTRTFSTQDPLTAARTAVEDVRRQGARLVIVLASAPRRIARTIAANVPGVHFVIAAREESPRPPPPERIGNAYLLTASNQGKTVGIIDVYLRGDDTTLVDASEATAAAARNRLDQRIAELRSRLAEWERDPTVDRTAVAQQRTRLNELERERAALARTPSPPTHGSYFRARVEEIAPEMTKHPDIESLIASYFRTVNEHNRQAYAHLRPAAPAPGQAGYVGIEQCRDCHEEAYAIWERTPHARAYHTLEALSKNYNLSCVGCHVTGYRRPGGAEVVQNEGLQDVQCESCHGPGSLHVAARGAAQRRATIVRNPPASLCANECHTPEHSDHFDYATYLPRILGPGHGYPLDSDGGGVSLSMPVLATDSASIDAGSPPADASGQ